MRFCKPSNFSTSSNANSDGDRRASTTEKIASPSPLVVALDGGETCDADDDKEARSADDDKNDDCCSADRLVAFGNEEVPQSTDDDDDGIRRPNLSPERQPIMWATARSSTRHKADRRGLSLNVLDVFILERAKDQSSNKIRRCAGER